MHFFPGALRVKVIVRLLHLFEAHIISLPVNGEGHHAIELFPGATEITVNLGYIRFRSETRFPTLFPHFLSNDIGPDTMKPVFGVSDKARLKPVSSASETS